MAVRHEEKYIIDLRQYAMLKHRAMALLTPDPHGNAGSYTINSLYYDDVKDTALLEKLDGLPEHRKFRVRTYDYDGSLIRLERKDKRGILTEKASAVISAPHIAALATGEPAACDQEDAAFPLIAQMRKAGLRPSVVVRYERDAFFFRGSDFRLTFDRNLESLSPDPSALFDPSIHGIPALDRNCVILEIKYGSRLPAFARTFLNPDCKQLSVSKYALCRGVTAAGRSL